MAISTFYCIYFFIFHKEQRRGSLCCIIQFFAFKNEEGRTAFVSSWP
jgi:hypothetical protein